MVALVHLQFSKLVWNTHWTKKFNTEREEATNWKSNISAGQMADKYWNLQKKENKLKQEFIVCDDGIQK